MKTNSEFIYKTNKGLRRADLILKNKEFIDNKIKEKITGLRVLDFLTLYNEDGLNHIIKNTEFWVKDTFANLKIYDA